MPRSSIARSVARAAASGGSKSYRAQRPRAWYALMTLIVVLGVGLTVYTRNEKNSTGSKPSIGPSATDHWVSALGIDLCGSIQPDLAPSSNLTSVGLRTFGNGLIDINPGAVAASASYEGANATLGNFAVNYSGLTLTNTSIQIPGKLPVLWSNGATCNGPLHGKGKLVAKVWSSPTASPSLVSTNITSIHLDNGKMITLAFVPVGASIPEPSSKATLISTMAQNAKVGSIGTTTTLPSTVPTSAGTSTTTTLPATGTSNTSSTSSTGGVPSVTPSTSSTSSTTSG
ncbi:MAG TPA: hypothetical protein VMU99_09935 [Acidimicrobiales bacterium]|nr:hypothetical protein [Acidimicrobiales bacterium]